MSGRWRNARRAGLGALLSLLWLAAAPAGAWADLFGRTPQATEDAQPRPAPLAPAELAEALPRAWRGTFLWQEGAAYYIELEIADLEVQPDGAIGFTAESRWQPGELRARMRGRIDPASLAVSIWEIPETGSADGFESDGQYYGTLAADLWDLRATWVTTATGDTGTLVLVAKAVAASR